MSVTIPNHSILPISQTDLPTIAEFLLASKLSLAINRFLFKDWPNESAQTAQYTRTIKGGFQDPTSEVLKVVHDATGEMVAHLVLTHKKPATEPSGVAATQEPSVPEGMVPEVFNSVIKASGQIQDAVSGVEHLGKQPALLVFSNAG